MKKIWISIAFLCCLLPGIVSAALIPSKIYMRSSGGEPWGVNNNDADMDAVFGAGNWRTELYESNADATVMLTNATFIYMDGGDGIDAAFSTFLTANLTKLQNWVSAGGHLIINCAPWNIPNTNYGFGGVLLNVNQFSANAAAVNSAHPIFNGPFLPVGTAWSGNSFGHATITGGGTDRLITGDASPCAVVLSQLQWGSGLVLFGGMTTDNFQNPQPQSANLKKNIFAYANAGVFTASAGSPPSATVSLSPSILFFPNQSMQTINATVTISGGTSPSFQLLSVTSSDADAGTFAGDQPNDIVAATGTAATTFQVRAETKPNGNGRFYTVTYRLFDGACVVNDYIRKVTILQNGGFITPNSAGTCGLQLASAIPDFTGPTLTIPYTLSSPGTATMSVYSLRGKELSRLLNNVPLGAGAGNVVWNGNSTYGLNPGTLLPNGTYVLLFKGCSGSDARVFTINH